MTIQPETGSLPPSRAAAFALELQIPQAHSLQMSYVFETMLQWRSRVTKISGKSIYTRLYMFQQTSIVSIGFQLRYLINSAWRSPPREACHGHASDMRPILTRVSNKEHSRQPKNTAMTIPVATWPRCRSSEYVASSSTQCV